INGSKDRCVALTLGGIGLDPATIFWRGRSENYRTWRGKSIPGGGDRPLFERLLPPAPPSTRLEVVDKRGEVYGGVEDSEHRRTASRQQSDVRTGLYH